MAGRLLDLLPAPRPFEQAGELGAAAETLEVRLALERGHVREAAVHRPREHLEALTSVPAQGTEPGELVELARAERADLAGDGERVRRPPVFLARTQGVRRLEGLDPGPAERTTRDVRLASSVRLVGCFPQVGDRDAEAGQRGRGAFGVTGQHADGGPELAGEVGLPMLVVALRLERVLVRARAAYPRGGLGVRGGFAQPTEVRGQGVEGPRRLDRCPRALLLPGALFVAPRPLLDEGGVLRARSAAHGPELEPFEGQRTQLGRRPLVSALPGLETVRDRSAVQVRRELPHLGQIEVVEASPGEQEHSDAFGQPRAIRKARAEGDHARHLIGRTETHARSDPRSARESRRVDAAGIDGDAGVRVAPEPADDVAY